jgi:hypothetical protein
LASPAGQDSLSRDVIMYFTIICVVSSAQTIAAGSGIRERCRLTVSLRRLSMATEPSDLAVCVDNLGYEAALERRKLYALLPDAEAEGRGLLRVVDESGEDYLYPAKNFHKVELPAAVRRAVFQAA